jgi:ATP-dependent Clp protease ATP-binding subunit ClpB
MTDGKGETIEYRNALFIMTSNLASAEIEKLHLEVGNQDDIEVPDTFKEEVIQPILKSHFKRVEFIGEDQ